MHDELVTDLLKECAKMKELDHPNVLTLKGVCLDGGPAPYIIMPFLPSGNLLSYLKKHRETLVIDPESTDLGGAVSQHRIVASTVLIIICIAEGSSKAVVRHVYSGRKRNGVSGQQKNYT